MKKNNIRLQKQMQWLLNYIIDRGPIGFYEAWSEEVTTIKTCKECFKKGYELESRDIAKTLLKNGYKYRYVSKVTDLPLKDIKSLSIKGE